MDKSVSQERKALTRSKKGVGPCPAKLHRAGLDVHDRGSEARVRQPTYFTKISKISKAAQARIRQAINGITDFARGRIAERSRYKSTVRPMTKGDRNQVIHLLFSVLRKADISSRHVLGAKLYRGYWWIQFEEGWIKMSQLLRYKTTFKKQYPNHNHSQNHN